MLELYHNDVSTCAQKVRLVLAEAGLDYKGHHLDLRTGEALTPDYLKLNPSGVVPTLVDDGAVIIESTIISEYLVDAYEEAKHLQPKTSVERAHMRLQCKRLDDHLHVAIGVITFSSYIRQQFIDMGRSDTDMAAHFNAIPDQARRDRQMDLWKNGAKSEKFAAAVRQWDRQLSDMETMLTEGDFLSGETYSLAETAYTPYINRLENLQFHDMVLGSHPHVAAWWQRIKARPSFETAMTQWIPKKSLDLMKKTGTDVWPQVREILGLK